MNKMNNFNNVTPMPGDYSICLNCGEWCEYAEDMALIKMSEKTKKELPPETTLLLVSVRHDIKKRAPLKK